MRVGVLVLAAGRTAGGPETYEIELLRALANVDRVNEYVIYCPQRCAEEAIAVHRPNFTYRHLQPPLRIASLSLSLPYLLRRDKIDIFHATYAPPPVPPPRMVFTCHGLANFLYPDYFPPFTRWRLNWLQQVGLRHATKILCVSQHTIEQLKRKMNICEERLALAHHGVNEEFRVRPREQARSEIAENLGISDPYILYVGKVQYLKNVPRLIQAFGEFRRKHDSNLKLVLAGKAVDPMILSGDSVTTPNVLQLGYIPKSKLPALYQAATMLVFPSLFESFGLPVLEAMACGVPVVSSGEGALPEICGDAAHIIDPHSSPSIARGMAEVYENAELRRSLIDRGLRRAKLFSWIETARATLSVYHDVFSNNGAAKARC